mmetsp:Transcript_33201/g.76624  ORF Transcript_33201/g.76624 Transcript_33201/m.76624 type:complete len:238 (-) Transcript_33201:752-1465(-)
MGSGLLFPSGRRSLHRQETLGGPGDRRGRFPPRLRPPGEQPGEFPGGAQSGRGGRGTFRREAHRSPLFSRGHVQHVEHRPGGSGRHHHPPQPMLLSTGGVDRREDGGRLSQDARISPLHGRGPLLVRISRRADPREAPRRPARGEVRLRLPTLRGISAGGRHHGRKYWGGTAVSRILSDGNGGRRRLRTRGRHPDQACESAGVLAWRDGGGRPPLRPSEEDAGSGGRYFNTVSHGAA